MRKLLYKLKPESGLSSALHYALNALLPSVILGIFWLAKLYGLTNNVPMITAAALVLLSKWRMLAIKPRFWFSNIRSNLVDIFLGLSVVSFIAGTSNFYIQLIWAVVYTFWLSWLKPQSKPVPVMIQALLAQGLGLVAFYRAFPNSSMLISILITWLLCYASARHFLGAFDETLVRAITNIWAWFGAVMAWILGHWVIDYLFLPQIVLVLSILGYGLASIYYLHAKNKLSSALKNQIIGVMGLLLLIIIVFSDWQDKTI